MYEPKTHRILPHKLFIRRVVLHFAASLGLLLLSLALGIAGYEHFEQLPGVMRF